VGTPFCSCTAPMRASWGYDQSKYGKEPSIAAPGMRISPVPGGVDERDPTIPEGKNMDPNEYETTMREMKKYAFDKELNLTHTFQGTAGKSTGIISKPRFKTAMGMLFHQFPLSEAFIAAICFKYGCGPPDPHAGGSQEVMWRAFVIDLRNTADPPAAQPPDPTDYRVTEAMSELRQIAEYSGLDMTHSLQGAGGQPTGTMAKQKFFMAMTSLLFPHYHFTTQLLNDLALVYANTKGPPDLRLGGYQEVLWRQFVIDIRRAAIPEARPETYAGGLLG